MCYLFILFNYYYIPFHKDSSKINKNSVHITADRESKELSVDLEWILYSKRWSKLRRKDDLLLIKTASKTKYRISAQRKYFLRCKWSLQIYLYHLWHLSCVAKFGRAAKFISFISCRKMAYRKSGTKTLGWDAGPRTLAWDHGVGPSGGTMGWDPGVEPWGGTLGWNHGVRPCGRTTG